MFVVTGVVVNGKKRNIHVLWVRWSPDSCGYTPQSGVIHSKQNFPQQKYLKMVVHCNKLSENKIGLVLQKVGMSILNAIVIDFLELCSLDNWYWLVSVCKQSLNAMCFRARAMGLLTKSRIGTMFCSVADD